MCWKICTTEVQVYKYWYPLLTPLSLLVVGINTLGALILELSYSQDLFLENVR